jgi:hypothetical protein
MIKVASNLLGLVGVVLFGFPIGAIAQLSPPAEVQPERSLVSPDSGIDYAPLQQLLQSQQWRSANEMTGQLMQRAAGRNLQGWVRTEDIAQFPCWDLKTIDNLWMTASKGRFGFTPQFAIYIETGNRPGRLVASDSYDAFGDRVGWRGSGDAIVARQWIGFKENLNFSLSAPVGHLPNPRQEYQITGGRLQYTALTKRLLDCKVVSVPSNPKK